MKKNRHRLLVMSGAIMLCGLTTGVKAQTLEWRLLSPTYSSIDPDGSGPARGTVSFKLQIHTVSGSLNNVSGLSTGWSFQSAKAMVPTGSSGPGCPVDPPSLPANVTVSPEFAAAGFTYSTVNQCGSYTQSTGGQAFDKRAVGTLVGTSITLTTTWVDVFTVTLWALGNSAPEGGYVVINSGNKGAPGAFGTYEASNVSANPFVVNSQSYNSPLGLGSGLFPVTLSKFNASCNGSETFLTWETLTESNNERFEVEKSADGTSGWNAISSVKGVGNSTTLQRYEFKDVRNGDVTYYRLRQVDQDGKSALSDIRKTSCESNASQLAVYPVPAQNLVNIAFTAERNGKAVIKLIDVAGRVLKLQKVEVIKGANTFKLNVGDLITGQYILQIVRDNEVQTKEVLIAK